jgi:hypothetical protein
MNWKQRAVLAGLAMALICSSACRKQEFRGQGPGAGHKYGLQDKRDFEVYIYTDPRDSTKCLADWPVGSLWRRHHQTVTWFSDDGETYTVDFTQGTHSPKSPFHSDTFTVQSNGKQASGDLLPNASGYYDFAILNASGKTCKDVKDPGYYVGP